MRSMIVLLPLSERTCISFVIGPFMNWLAHFELLENSCCTKCYFMSCGVYISIKAHQKEQSFGRLTPVAFSEFSFTLFCEVR